MNQNLTIAVFNMLREYILSNMKEQKISVADIINRTGIKYAAEILDGEIEPSILEFIAIAQHANCYLFLIDKEADDELVGVMKSRYKRKGDSN